MELKFRRFELKAIQSPKSLLVPIELKDFIDFEVKRVYFITHPRTGVGFHCHKIEKEFFVMQQGSCVAGIDRGNGIEKFEMEEPGSAIYVGNYVWHQFENLSDDAILLALSSTNHNLDRSDYIDDYDEYKRFLETQNESDGR